MSITDIGARAAPSAPLVSLRDVHLAFGGTEVLKGIDVEVKRGQAVSIIGPSGSGKSTILRCITGLLRPQRGAIEVDGVRVDGLKTEADFIGLRKRVGFVFQQYNLFPHLSVLQNLVISPVKVGGQPRAQAEARARELLAKVRMEHKENAYPGELSGGQQQRVALARALALSPGLLLLDEPLSALDAQVRNHLRAEIRAIQRRLGVTTIMVTHDQEEALTMADRIVLMNDGRIEQVGSPREVYSRPATPFTAAFIGQMNVLAGIWADGCARVGDQTFNAAEAPEGMADRAAVTVCIRPEDVGLTANGAAGVPATIAGLEFCGSFLRLHAAAPSLGEAPIVVDLAPERANGLALGPGMECRLHLPHDRLRLYAGAPR